MKTMGQTGQFQTSRERLAEQYAKSGAPYQLNSRPYKSTVTVFAQVVTPLPLTAALMRVAYAVIPAGTAVEWFGYGIGDPIPWGNGITRPADDSDTNLSQARHTNGTDNLAIEGISLSCRGTRVSYVNGVGPQYTGGNLTVGQAHAGGTQSLDPAGIMKPPQCDSPFNLENPFMTAIAPNMSINFVWDRQRQLPIGTADEIPEGAAKSYLRANGVPATNNRYRVPEGYVWRQNPSPDSEFVVQGNIRQNIVVPISLTQLNGTSDPDLFSCPTEIAIDLTLRLHGCVFSLPSRN